MRNSEARRYARWSAGVALLLALAVAGVYLRGAWVARQAEKKAPPAVPATIEQRSNEFSYSKVEGQRTIYTVRASRTTEFKEGSRNLLEDVSITVYGKKGERNDTLRTRACDFVSITGKIGCEGEVQISLQPRGVPAGNSNAIQVVTSGVAFDRDSGLARTEKPVTFRWPAGEGRAVGVEYDSGDGTLHLEHNVELTLTGGLSAQGGVPPAQEQAIHLAGDSMLFRRDARTVQILGSVRALEATRELTAENLLLELDESFHARHLVASGRPHLRDSDIQGPISLEADQISTTMNAEGSMENLLANGNVRGSRKSPQGEDEIAAGSIQVALATVANVPRLLTARNGVTMTSRGATSAGGTRRLETDGLEVHFAKNSREGQALLESVNTLAPANIEWQNISAPQGKSGSAKPVKQLMRLRGQQMNLQFGGQNQLQQLNSSGGVEVTRQTGDGQEQATSSRELTAKFSNTGDWSTIDQSGDVHFHDASRTGQGDRAHLDRATNTATLSGSVLLADPTMRTTAQSATFTQGSNELRADGNVLSTELSGGTGGVNLAPEPAHVSAAHLVADIARGHATYSGSSRLWQGESVIEADTIELDNPTRILVARGHVRGLFPQAQAARPVKSSPGPPPARKGATLWHVKAGTLTDWGSESRARLEQDASAESPEGSIHANQIDLYFSSSSGAAPSSSAQQLSRVVAAGDVSIRQGDRRGTSDRAEYTTSEGKFVLSGGKPTVYDSTGDTTTGRQLTFFFADDRIVVDSEEGSRTLSLHRVEK